MQEKWSIYTQTEYRLSIEIDINENDHSVIEFTLSQERCFQQSDSTIYIDNELIDLLRNREKRLTDDNMTRNEDIEHIDFTESKVVYATDKLNVVVNNHSESEQEEFRVNNGILDLKVDNRSGHVYVLCRDQKIYKYSMKLNKLVDQIETVHKIKEKNDIKVGRIVLTNNKDSDDIIVYSLNKTVYYDENKLFKECRNVEQLMCCNDIVISYCGEEYLRLKKINGSGNSVRIGVQIKGVVQQIDFEQYYENKYIVSIEYCKMIQLYLIEYDGEEGYEIEDSHELETENLRIERVKVDKNNLIVVGVYEFKYRYKMIEELVHDGRINRQVDEELKEIDDVELLKEATDTKEKEKEDEFVENEDAELDLEEVSKKKGDREEEKMKVDEIEERINEKYPDVNIEEESLAVLLQESVLNKDNRIIDYIFSQSDPSIIYETVEKIDNQKIMQIMTEMVERIEKKYVHGQETNEKQNYIVEWLRILLGVHQSVILQHSESYKMLGMIKSYIVKRTACIDKLRDVKSRLKVMNAISEEQMLYEEQIEEEKWRAEYLEDEGFKEIDDTGIEDESEEEDEMIDDQFEDSYEEEEEDDDFDDVVKYEVFCL